MLNVLYYAGVGISYGLKAYAVGKTVYDVHHVIHDEELTQQEKVHRVATDIAFIGMQVVDCGVSSHLLGTLSNSVEIGTRIGTGVTDVAMIVSQKAIQDDIDFQDITDIAAEGLFRTADATALASTIVPSADSEALREITAEVAASAILLRGKDKIFSAAKKISERWSPSCLSENRTLLTAEAQYIKELDEVRNAKTIKDWSLIPPFFLNEPDRILNKWVCPLTKKPIRFVVVIIKTRNSTNPIFYEKSAIEKFISDYPRKIPPAWPKRISVRLRKLEIDSAVQNVIDMHLNHLLNSIQDQVASGEFQALYPENL